MRLYKVFAAVCLAALLNLARPAQAMIREIHSQADSALSDTVSCVGNSVNIDGGTLYVDCANNRVGIGTVSPTSPLTVSGSQTVGNSAVNSLVYVTPTVTSLGNASVYLGNYTQMTVTDTADHTVDASHAVAVIGRSSDTSFGHFPFYGGEFRVDITQVSTAAIGSVIQGGVLGFANGYDVGSRPNNNYIVGGQFRACWTTQTDCGGSGISTGNVAGIYISQVTGGAFNYGILQVGGNYNYFAGNIGIGINPPTATLDVRGTTPVIWVVNNGDLSAGMFQAFAGKVDLGTVTSVPLRFIMANGTEYGELDVSGNWKFGSVPAGTVSTFTAAGNLQMVTGSTITGNGTLTLSTSPSAGGTSDPNIFLDKNGYAHFTPTLSTASISGSLSGTFAGTTLNVCIAGSTRTVTVSTASARGTNQVMVGFTGSIANDGLGNTTFIGVLVDGLLYTGETTSKGFVSFKEQVATDMNNMSFARPLTNLSGGKHHICMLGAVSAGTATIDSTNADSIFWAYALP